MKSVIGRLSIRRQRSDESSATPGSPVSGELAAEAPWPRKGDYVMAKLDQWKKYYGGYIKGVSKKGDTFDILFDDGDRQKTVPRRCIVRPDEVPEVPVSAQSNNEGQATGGSDLTHATASLNTASPTSPEKPRARSIKYLFTGSPASPPKPDLSWPQRGDYVMAKLDEWSRYYGGEVKKVNKNGDSFDILFDDGDRQKNVPRRCICKPGEVPSSSSIADTQEPLMPSSRFIVGDRVSCKIAGWNSWYDGYVTAVNFDLTYVVQFDDGEVVSTVREKEMMAVAEEEAPLPTGPKPKLPEYVKINGRIEAKCEGWHKFYLGTIQAISTDNTSCTILFDDGEIRDNVKAIEVRPARTKSQMKITFDLSETVTEEPSDYKVGLSDVRSSKKKVLRRGMRVMANPWSEWTKAYPGRIEHQLNDGTYAILFDDGDRVGGIEADDIEVIEEAGINEGPSMENNEVEFYPGQSVEARVQGWRKFYPGKIRQENPDGTFVLDFLDGEVVHQVRIEEMRPSRQRTETTASEITEKPNSPDQVFRVGERVAAKLFISEKWRKYWGGEVIQVNEDGSYKVAFDDGEVYSQVWPVEMKRPKPGSALAAPILKAPPPEYFDVGERVEVKTLNWRSWYPGLVERRNPDHTYIVQFDDGERLLDIKLGEIRRMIVAKHHDDDDV